MKSSCFFQKNTMYCSVFAIMFAFFLSTKNCIAAQLELYGTFHSMGVIVTLTAGEDSDQDATALLEYREQGKSFQQGFVLTRVDNHFISSIFWLTPGKQYDVRVTIEDPDGGSLDGTRLQSTAFTRAEIAEPSPTHSYIVSPSGSGSLCTLSSPCSLETAISQADGGERVSLRGGVYHTGNISLPRSGSSGAPIVIQGYQDESAVLDGSDPGTFTWDSQGNGVYSTSISTDDTHIVLADGKRLFPYNSLTNLSNLSRDNTPGFYCSSGRLYVHLENDEHPGAANIVISSKTFAFSIEVDHIHIEDLTFRYYGQGGYPKAIYLNGASDVVIRECTFASNDLGVGLKRVAIRNVIEDCEFYDTIFDWPWDDIKDVGRLEDGGIRFYSPVDGRGNIIRRNVFHDDFDGFGICPGSTATVTNETDVYENTIYNMGDDGVEADGTCSNVRIWKNTFHDVLMGISLAPIYKGPVYAIRNVIHRTGVGNNDYTGSPFKFNSGYDKSGTMYLFHNTGDARYPGNNGLYIKAPGSWEKIHTRNNIWSGTDYGINNYNTSQLVDLDYDNIINTGENDLFRWNNVRYADLSSFRAATGQESHGFNVDPLFINPDAGNYNLQTNSPLIDRGLLIPGINSNYSGNGPDIGAFELLQVDPPLSTTTISPINILLLGE